MGRICFPDQLDSSSCFGSDGNWQVLAQNLCCLLLCKYTINVSSEVVGFERNCGELQWQGSELKKKASVLSLSCQFLSKGMFYMSDWPFSLTSPLKKEHLL